MKEQVFNNLYSELTDCIPVDENCDTFCQRTWSLFSLSRIGILLIWSLMSVVYVELSKKSGTVCPQNECGVASIQNSVALITVWWSSFSIDQWTNYMQVHLCPPSCILSCVPEWRWSIVEASPLSGVALVALTMDQIHYASVSCCLSFHRPDSPFLVWPDVWSGALQV